MTRLAAAILLCVFASGAEAQTSRCLPFKQWLSFLDTKYGEKPAYIGSTPGAVMTITVNPKTGSWTILLQPNSEIMCMMAAGKNWSDAPPALADPPAEPETPPAVVPQIERMPGVRREYLHPAIY